MHRLLLVLLLSAAACARQVTLQATPAAVVDVQLKVTNRTPQAITIVVLDRGTEYTLASVAANATELLPVRNVMAGSTVTLRATLADGSRSYTRENVVLRGVFEWEVP